MVLLRKQLLFYAKIIISFFLVGIIGVWYSFKISNVNYFIILSVVSLILFGCILTLTLIDLIIWRKLILDTKKLSKLLNLKITLILKDGDYYELIHKTPSLWKAFVKYLIRREKDTGLKDGILITRDVKKIVLWLKENPNTTLYTVTHERVIEILESVGKDSIVLINLKKEKKFKFHIWWKLTFKTQGNLKLNKPKSFYRYKVQLKVDEGMSQ